MADMYSGYMAGAYGIRSAASLAGAYAESEAIKSQSSFQREMARINAKLAARRADSVIKAGEEQVSSVRQKGKKVAGAQRAAAAAQGLDVTDGSVADQLTDTEQAVTADMLNVRNNAWREAWGIKTQSAFNSLEADQRSAAADFASQQTLLTGGLKALSSGLEGVGKYYQGSTGKK